MSKAGIRIAVRVRPTKNPSGFWSMSREKGTLEFDIPREVADGLVNNSRTTHKFKNNTNFVCGANVGALLCVLTRLCKCVCVCVCAFLAL